MVNRVVCICLDRRQMYGGDDDVGCEMMQGGCECDAGVSVRARIERGGDAAACGPVDARTGDVGVRAQEKRRC